MRERRSARLAGVLTLVVAVLVGCGGSGGTDTGSAPEPVAATVPDAGGLHPLHATVTPTLPVSVPSVDGHDVRVRDVSRIIPLTGSLSEIVFSLGLGDRVVARDVATTFAAAADLPVITHGHQVSAESVLSLRPTVVLAGADTGPPQAIKKIRATGVPVVVFPAADEIADVTPRIRAVAEALGVPDAGDTLAARTAREIEQAGTDTGGSPLRVAFLYLRGGSGVYLIGGDESGADSLIEAAGATDAGTAMGLDGFTPITSEALIEAAPDVLLLMRDGLKSVGGMDGLDELPGVAQTPAGKHGHVVTMADGVLLNFGPRTAEVITALSGALDEFR